MSKEFAADLLEINEHALDKECLRLPSDFLKAAHHAADLGRDVEESKREFDVMEAELGKTIRANPGDYGLEKVTESAIRETILTLPKFRIATQKLQNARHEYELAQALVRAMEHKKRSLQMLVELHATSWFSKPKLSPEGKEAVDEMTKATVRRNLTRGR